MTPTTPRTPGHPAPVHPDMTYRPPLPLTRPMDSVKPPVRPGLDTPPGPPPSRTARINALLLLALLAAFCVLGWVLTR
jgi:hypothetical protein